MVRIFRNVFLILLIFSSFAAAQSISLTASTDSSDYLVGDYIKYTIKAEFSNDVRISPPVLTDQIPPLEVIKTLPVTFDKEKNVQYFNYIVAGYDSARVVIPKVPINYFVGNSSEPQTAYTNEVVVFIHTLEVDQQADIKDVKEPIRIPLDWTFWLLLILGILILAAIAYFLYKKFKKPVVEEKIIKRVPKLPVHVLTLRALDELNAKKLWQKGQVKEYHSEITEIIRKYFEDRYNFNSLEMTTAQTVEVVNRVMDNQKVINITKKFLENADLVKFAKFDPLASVNVEMMIQAHEIVEKTRAEDHVEDGARSVQ